MKIQQKNIDDTIPFLQLFVDEVVDSRIEILQKKKKLSFKIIIYIITIIVLIISLISVVQFDLYLPFVVSILCKIISVFGIIFMFYQIINAYSVKNTYQKEYEEIFRTELYSIIISTLQPTWKYEENFYFSAKDLIESDIFNEKIKIKNTAYSIEGELESFLADIYKIHAKVHHDEQNQIIPDYFGIFLKITLDRTTNNRAIIAPRMTSQNFNSNPIHKLNLHQKGYELHNESEVTFNKYFKIYNTQNYDLPEMLTPTLQRQLAHFVLNHKKEVYLSFQKNKLYISIKTDEISILPSLKGDVSPKVAAEHFYNELQITMDLLKRMK